MVSVVQALGRFGEQIAAEHLQAQGMVVLDRRWRCRDGEIDLVMREGRTLVIVEVKTRSGIGFGSPAEAVTPIKVRRLRRLAAAWLEAHDVRPDVVRIDVVGVVRGAQGLQIDHLKGVE